MVKRGHASPERFTHYMAVDEGRGFHGLLVDLSGLQHSIVNPDSFVDPSILEVNWGMVSEPDGRDDQPDAREGQVGRHGVT